VSKLKLVNEAAKKLTSHTFMDEYECAESIVDMVIDEVLAIVIKEPDYISSSQSTRQGYVRAVNDMERAIKALKK